MFKGTAASPGIVLGKALVLEHNELVIEKKSISDVDKEIERLNDAVAISKAELEKGRIRGRRSTNIRISFISFRRSRIIRFCNRQSKI